MILLQCHYAKAEKPWAKLLKLWFQSRPWPGQHSHHWRFPSRCPILWRASARVHIFWGSARCQSRGTWAWVSLLFPQLNCFKKNIPRGLKRRKINAVFLFWVYDIAGPSKVQGPGQGPHLPGAKGSTGTWHAVGTGKMFVKWIFPSYHPSWMNDGHAFIDMYCFILKAVTIWCKARLSMFYPLYLGSNLIFQYLHILIFQITVWIRIRSSLLKVYIPAIETFHKIQELCWIPPFSSCE